MPGGMTRPEIDAVREWLRGEGYPLEYETAREMARVGYRPWQGRYYRDPETADYREVDVQAVEPDSGGAHPTVWILAECKHNTKPWLVLTHRAALPAGYGANFAVVAGLDREILTHAAGTAAGYLVNPPARFGYSVVQAISGPDVPFAALQTITKAAWARVHQNPHSAGIALPFIVVDGSLYQLGFEDDGSEVLEPVLWQRVVWHGSWRPEEESETRGVQVDVVTRGHLPVYLRELRAATQALAQPGPPRATRGR